MPTILLTAAGGAALPALIAGLQVKGHRVIAVDADPNAAGLYLADRGYRIPFANDAEFAPTMRKILKTEDVRFVVPLVDEELLPLTDIAHEMNIAIIGPRRDFMALCLDKYPLMQRMAENGLPVPATRLLRNGIQDMSFPLILKPRTGRGSRGIKVVYTQAQLDEYLATAQPDKNATMVQTYVEGIEFTVSVVVSLDGVIRAVVPKEIIDKRGITRMAVTRRHDAIDRLCRTIQECLKADGPFNVQLRIDGASNVPFTFEINPRFSTTVTLTQAAGVDELGSLIDLALGTKLSEDCWKWREGVTLVRRTVDAFLDFDSYSQRRKLIEQAL